MELNRSIARKASGGTFLVSAIPAAVVLTALLVAVFLLKRNFSSGAWIDEYATLWFADPSIDLPTIYRERWLAETNPPLYYFLVWIFRRFSDGDIEKLRAVHVGFLASSVAYLVWTGRRHAQFVPFLAAAGILFLSSGDQFRQICWSFTFSVSLALLLGRPRPPAAQDRLDRLDGAVFVATLFTLLNLHFTAALLAGAVSAVAIVYAFVRRDWRLARFLALSVVVCTGLAATFVLIRLSMLTRQLDTFWIATTPPQVVRLMMDVARGAISKNVVLLALLGLALLASVLRRVSRGGPATSPARAFAHPFAVAIVFATGVLGFFATLCVFSLFKPIVILRYLVVAGPPLTVACCLGAADLLERRPIVLAGVFANGLVGVALLAAQPGQPRDDAAGRMLAQFHATCPETPILGVAYGDPRGFAETGDRYLARRFRVPIETVRIGPAWTPPRSATCPTVLWSSHLFEMALPNRVDQIVTAAQLVRVMRLRLTDDDLARAEIHLLDGADPILVLPPSGSR
jgi:hypothetical protein